MASRCWDGGSLVIDSDGTGDTSIQNSWLYVFLYIRYVFGKEVKEDMEERLSSTYIFWQMQVACTIC